MFCHLLRSFSPFFLLCQPQFHRLGIAFHLCFYQGQMPPDVPVRQIAHRQRRRNLYPLQPGDGWTLLLAGIFGAYWYLFAALLLFNVLDWLSGWYTALR